MWKSKLCIILLKLLLGVLQVFIEKGWRRKRTCFHKEGLKKKEKKKKRLEKINRHCKPPEGNKCPNTWDTNITESDSFIVSEFSFLSISGIITTLHNDDCEGITQVDSLPCHRLTGNLCHCQWWGYRWPACLCQHCTISCGTMPLIMLNSVFHVFWVWKWIK